MSTDPPVDRSAPHAALFAFRFDPRFRPLLAAAGVTPWTSGVRVGAGLLHVRFGPWTLRTPLDNVIGTELTGHYRWWRAIGPRFSFVDHGLTFGTNVDAGLCICFAEPVPGLDPARILRHPGLTVTVADPDGLRDALRDAGAGGYRRPQRGQAGSSPYAASGTIPVQSP